MNLKKYNKIFICGISGAGKTTLATKVSKKFGHLPIYMDEHFWQNNWVERTTEDFFERVDNLVKKERWVLEGAVSKLIKRYSSQADIVIWLNVSRYIAIYRVLKRLYFHKNNRYEMPEGCEDRFDFSFIKWIWRYPSRSEDMRKFFKENKINFIEVSNIKKT